MPLRSFNEKMMNFLAKAISSPSSTQSRKCIALLQTLTSFQQSCFFSSKSRKPRVDKTLESSSLSSAVSFNPPKPENESKPLSSCKTPCQIPFHSNVANSVDLIGFVDSPVQFEALPNGRRVAKTVLFSTQDGDLVRSVSIPVVFQDDMADIAKFHVKENDCIYVSGQLSGDHLPSNWNQRDVHLLVQIMNFVVGLKRKPAEISGLRNDDADDDNVFVKQKKGNKNLRNCGKTMNAEQWKNWRDLINNPKQWKDYRERKCNGTVKAGHPDFKHKESKISLWLSNVPQWVLPGLQGLEFNEKQVESAN